MIAFAHDNIIPMPQKSNEWYTPARYVEAAREVMGGIDLDPASCELANRTVKAPRYYSEHDNGLTQNWYGNVWINPPYGKGVNNEGKAASFARKMIKEYREGNINQAMFLIYEHCLSTSWGGILWDYLICFLPYRIAFYTERGVSDTAAFGSIFVYLGANEQRFINIFSEFGTVARRVSKPKERPVTLSLWGDA